MSANTDHDVNVAVALDVDIACTSTSEGMIFTAKSQDDVDWLLYLAEGFHTARTEHSILVPWKTADQVYQPLLYNDLSFAVDGEVFVRTPEAIAETNQLLDAIRAKPNGVVVGKTRTDD